MMFPSYSLLASGLVPLPGWGYIVIAFVLTHITIVAVTVYLHRSQAHRGLDLHPAVSHFFRFWLWLTTGIVTKEWVAVHRKHHAKVETDEESAQPADAWSRQASAKLSSRWYEFDLGWMYIRGLEVFGLATVRRVAPRLKLDCAKLHADLETLQSVITHRYAVVTSYAQSVKQAYKVEVAQRGERARRGEFTPSMPSFRRLRQWFLTDESALVEIDRTRLASTLEQSAALKTLYAMGRELATLWEHSTDSSDVLLARLQAWCRQAEASNIVALQSFSRRLRRYA